MVTDSKRRHELYRSGYREGLEHSIGPQWTSEYTNLDYDEREEYDRGFRNGRIERWRREEEEDW